ncbi:DUF5133 domain-containing protein [Streptomyces sp. NRRL F-5126]|uniref:DUF5133 domain-containing protein n=1 Tax=Streptomyces sp. NRRL F-5126 TaxID=1463857 RepID=UPI002D21AC18|nr:DUF5133 domain-containing protein [Streptomyces sp. NRRL F-5126]
MAHPAVLRPLVKEYEALTTLPCGQSSEQTRRRLEDVAYTLCVATGTLTIEAALRAARSRLSVAVRRDDSFIAQDDLTSEASGSASTEQPTRPGSVQ